jgi:MFS family permease
VAAPARPDWTWRGLPPGFQRLLLAISIFTLGQASNAFVILRAHDLGMPVAQAALLWAVVAATSTLLAVPLSAYSDRVGRVPLLTVGWLLHVALFVVLGWTSDVALMWPAAVLLGVYMAATEGSERALIADLVPQQRLGTAYGWYYLAKGLLLLPASAVFGWLWVVSGATAAFMLAASFVALATLALVVWVLPAVRHAHRGRADR